MSLAVVLPNPFPVGAPVNRVDGTALVLEGAGVPEDHPMAGGSLCVLAGADRDVSIQPVTGSRVYVWVDLRADGQLEGEPITQPRGSGLPSIGRLLADPERAADVYARMIPNHRSIIERTLVINPAAWAAEAPSDPGERWRALVHRAVVDRSSTRALAEAVVKGAPVEPAARLRVEAAILAHHLGVAAPARVEGPRAAPGVSPPVAS